MFELRMKQFIVVLILAMGCWHLMTVSRVPRVGTVEAWYTSPSYTYFKYGDFHDTMFPDLIEYENGHIGHGKLTYVMQASAYKLLGFGLYASRLPAVLCGLLITYGIFLVGRHLFGTLAGILGAGGFIFSSMFYTTHEGAFHAWVACGYIFSAYFFLKLLVQGRVWQAVMAGFLVGITLSFHYTGILGVIPLSLLVCYYRWKGELTNAHFVGFFVGGFATFVIWCLLEVVPVGLDAFLKKAEYGSDISQQRYIGAHWFRYFVEGRRGTFMEIPLLILGLASIRVLTRNIKLQFFYLYFLGLTIAYTLFSGSGELITVWAPLFVLVGGCFASYVSMPISRWSMPTKAWASILLFTFLYYGAVHVKRANDAFRINMEAQYYDLTNTMSNYIPKDKVVMGSPLFWFGFVGRNPYITQGFYWDRLNEQTNELGDIDTQPMAVTVEKMLKFLKSRQVEYFIADEYFKNSIRIRIPETYWGKLFQVETEFESNYYGAPSGGGVPPYKIQVWRLVEGGNF